MNVEKSNKKAVIYCRVSTKEQVDEGTSLITQERVCRDFCSKHGYEIAEVYIEQGESAKTADRTELKKLLAFCTTKANSISAVVAYKLDRIARNTDDYAHIRVLLKRVGVDIKSTSEYFEDTPTGRFMENIIANVAQFDNDIRTERSIAGMKEAMREGRYVWKAPLGYTNLKIGGKSTITTTDKSVYISKAFQLLSSGTKSVVDVWAQLVQEGLTQETGKPISLKQFHKLLNNELYTGWIIKFKERHRGTFPAIVDKDMFDHVQYILLSKKQTSKQYTTNNPDFPLRKFVMHTNGLKLTGSWSKGKRKLYPYYFFRQARSIFQRSDLHIAFSNFLDNFTFSDEHLQTLKDKVLSILDKKLELNQEQKSVIDFQIQELKKKQVTLVDKNASGIISDMLLKDLLDETERQLADLRSIQLSVDWEFVPNKGALLKHSERFLKSPGVTWLQSPFEVKQKLQVFYFPKGVEYDGNIFRTTEICSLYKVKTEILDVFSPKVTFKNFKSNTPEVDNQKTTVLCDELLLKKTLEDLKTLSRISNEYSQK